MEKKKEKSRRGRRVALVGCDNLSPYAVNSLLNSSELDELVLVGELPEGLIDELKDLSSAEGAGKSRRYWVGTISDAARADVVVVGAEMGCRGGEIRQVKESEWVGGTAQRLRELGFDGVCLVTVEPIQAMLSAAVEGNLPARKVIGLGGSPNGVMSPSCESSVWCTGTQSDVQFMDFCDPMCPYFREVSQGARNARKSTGSKIGDVAICVTSVCEAILSTRLSLIPIWATGSDGMVRHTRRIVGKGDIFLGATFEPGKIKNDPAEVL